MYYYGETVEGILRIAEDTSINNQRPGRTLLISGKFLLYGDFVTAVTTRTTLEGKTVTVNEILPVTGIVFSKLLDYIFIANFFYNVNTGERYAYIALVPERNLKKIVKLFGFWDVVHEELPQELDEYIIQL